MDHVIFPRFWREKPALWFAQVEAVFALNKIFSDNNKYDYIITELNNDVICLLEDVILNPPGPEVNNKYIYLKKEVIKRLSLFQLDREELGDKKPSEFLRHLRCMADKLVSEEKIRDVWLKKLPKHVQDIVSIKSSISMEMLSELADRVLEVNSSSCQYGAIGSVEEISKCLQKLSIQLQNLQVQMKKIEVAFKEHDKTVDETASRKDQSRAPLLNYCWYHMNFGDKATKCIDPCEFSDKNTTQDFLNTTSY